MVLLLFIGLWTKIRGLTDYVCDAILLPPVYAGEKKMKTKIKLSQGNDPLCFQNRVHQVLLVLIFVEENTFPHFKPQSRSCNGLDGRHRQG